jgi:hypothetical protein
MIASEGLSAQAASMRPQRSAVTSFQYQPPEAKDDGVRRQNLWRSAGEDGPTDRAKYTELMEAKEMHADKGACTGELLPRTTGLMHDAPSMIQTAFGHDQQTEARVRESIKARELAAKRKAEMPPATDPSVYEVDEVADEDAERAWEEKQQKRAAGLKDKQEKKRQKRLKKKAKGGGAMGAMGEGEGAEEEGVKGGVRDGTLAAAPASTARVAHARDASQTCRTQPGNVTETSESHRDENLGATSGTVSAASVGAPPPRRVFTVAGPPRPQAAEAATDDDDDVGPPLPPGFSATETASAPQQVSAADAAAAEAATDDEAAAGASSDDDVGPPLPPGFSATASAPQQVSAADAAAAEAATDDEAAAGASSDDDVGPPLPPGFR